ncbi:hypothetical protein [Xanthomonas citri]|uniref:hypothetical protein n=1 Tax=Xanthomonas citri TaxID=346 RepID=UPI001C049847|nr:hypothetical protein [Xanthomonas citri]QWN07004.1 hypothetical protein DGN11_05710 [Xanthomonas citri pv. fuscans]
MLQGIGSDPLEASVTVGVLPRDYGFDEVTEALQRIPGDFFAGSNSGTREIRFVPQDAFVYDSLADMLRRRTSALGQVPEKFALRDSEYKHGVTLHPPPSVNRYFEAVDLWKALREVASYKTGDQTLHFVAGHDKEACISLQYDVDDLILMPSLQSFIHDIARTELHRQEKLTIARAGIVEQFSRASCVSFGELVKGFEQLMMYIRQSYALFLADFSTAKVRREVEKQNLDDALRLNKTLAEIQNQLLALPAALLVAGATVDSSSASKNVAVLIGMAIFVVLMWLLIENQNNSVEAIGDEIKLRRELLEAQPKGIADQYKYAFDVLKKRVKTQLNVLFLVKSLVVVVFLLTAYMAVDALAGGSISNYWYGVYSGSMVKTRS